MLSIGCCLQAPDKNINLFIEEKPTFAPRNKFVP